jgi:hypothetical protein
MFREVNILYDLQYLECRLSIKAYHLGLENRNGN